MRSGLILLFLSGALGASELQYTGQHLKLNRQNESAWSHELLGSFTTSRKFDFGLGGTYLERFDNYERAFSLFGRYHPNSDWAFDFKYSRGQQTEILPKDRYSLTAYHALTTGISPYLILQSALYTVTHLNSVSLGIEIEKISSIIIIPQVMGGSAKFSDEKDTEGIHSLGLKVIHYNENHYSIQVFASLAREAAQAVVGESTMTLNTRTIGAGASYYFIPSLKSELIFDYTDYEKIQNQFLTTTLNLTWVYL